MSEEQPYVLSESQKIFWEQRLIDAEKAVEVAKRALGIIVVKEETNE